MIKILSLAMTLNIALFGSIYTKYADKCGQEYKSLYGHELDHESYDKIVEGLKAIEYNIKHDEDDNLFHNMKIIYLVCPVTITDYAIEIDKRNK